MPPHSPPTGSVFTVVEQFWHRLPGGTAVATEELLKALSAQGDFRLGGVAARHSCAAKRAVLARRTLPEGFALAFSPLPRPVLYELWLRGERPSVDAQIGHLHHGDGVLWASSTVVPPTALPTVTTVHDLDFLRYPEMLSRRGRRFFPRMWEVAKRRSTLLVCPSQVVAADVVADGVPSENVQVVPWGVAEPLVGVGEAEAVVHGAGVPQRFVLWVGAPLQRKNPEGALAAMRATSLPLVAVGADDGTGRTGSALDALGSRLHVLGQVDGALLSALYRRADAVLYPSIAEGFGLPVLEAMAHGTPVVTSAGTATEEVAAGAGVLVDPYDHAAIGEALESVLSDGARRRQLVEAGLVVAERYSWERAATGYGAAFRQALLRSRRGPGPSLVGAHRKESHG